MFSKLFGGKKTENTEEIEAPESSPDLAEGDSEPARSGFFGRMKQAVTRTRESLSTRLEGVLALTREIDEAALEELESALLTSDIGLTTTTEILEQLRDRAKRK